MKSNNSKGELGVKYRLSREVRFCKQCVVSNQQSDSTLKLIDTEKENKKAVFIDESGLCEACRIAKAKKKIDWKKREEEFEKVLNNYRSKDGSYDCIVQGSAGKDNLYAAWLLKFKYDMHPLTVTWAPNLFTDAGLRNIRSSSCLFDNLLFSPNGKVQRLLTKLAFEKLLQPFKPFMIGQMSFVPKMSIFYKIPLVFHCQNKSGYRDLASDYQAPSIANRYSSCADFMNFDLCGVTIKELISDYGLNMFDLESYLPADPNRLKDTGTQVYDLGDYLNWFDQESYDHAVEKFGFIDDEESMDWPYSKYSSMCDKMAGLYYYTLYIRCGMGRCTYDVARAIRNGHITREKGVDLVNHFDSEYRDKYFKELLEYLDISEERFWQIINSKRPAHLWAKEDGEWKRSFKVS